MSLKKFKCRAIRERKWIKWDKKHRFEFTSLKITSNFVNHQLKEQMWFSMPVYWCINHNWHELRKEEICSSSAPLRSKFYKTQWAWQGVGHIFPPNFFLPAGFPPNFSSWQIILLGLDTPRHYFSWDFILLDIFIILPIHFSPRQ